MPGFIGGASQGAAAGAQFGPWGALAGGVIGGVLGSAEGDNGARDRMQAQEAFAERQFEFQQQLAKNGVRWRVEDAKAAGIHPAVALGMQPANASAIGLTFDDAGRDRDSTSWLSQFGHNVARSATSTQTADERAYSAAMNALALQRGELENQLLATRIGLLQKDQVGPPMADPGNPGVRMYGTSDAGRIKEEPMGRSSAFVGRPYQEAGAVTELGFSKTASGYAPVMSKDFKERAEDDVASEASWHFRNRVPQTLGFDSTGLPPPETWLPEGAVRWVWHPFKQEWQPAYEKKKGWTFFKLSRDGKDVAKF